MKTKYFKNGDPNLYNYFADHELKNMTEKERAMWTPFSEDNLAPIPKDVLDFQEKHTQDGVCMSEKCRLLEAKVEELEAKLAMFEPKGVKDIEISEEEMTGISHEEKEKKLVKAELDKLGITYRHNTGVVKLRQKLEDAKNAND